jgi:uncharacterized membrane protein YgaE (UPF0421/DUF939 family)
MKIFKENTRGETIEFYEYIVKCLAGVSIGYMLLKAFPRESGQSYWVLLSILLSITHDNNSKVAYDRMRGNIVGSLAGLLTFLLHKPPNLLTVCVGVVLTITVCFRFNLKAVCRTALVGFIIVLIYEGDHGSWTGAIYRMGSVVAGCFIGLMMNYTFRKLSVPVLRSLEHEDKGDGGE